MIDFVSKDNGWSPSRPFDGQTVYHVHEDTLINEQNTPVSHLHCLLASMLLCFLVNAIDTYPTLLASIS